MAVTSDLIDRFFLMSRKRLKAKKVVHWVALGEYWQNHSIKKTEKKKKSSHDVLIHFL